jgi:hypothetical protein
MFYLKFYEFRKVLFGLNQAWMSLNQFEINQTYLNPAGPPVSALSLLPLPAGPTLSWSHPSASPPLSLFSSLPDPTPCFSSLHGTACACRLPSTATPGVAIIHNVAQFQLVVISLFEIKILSSPTVRKVIKFSRILIFRVLPRFPCKWA